MTDTILSRGHSGPEPGGLIRRIGLAMAVYRQRRQLAEMEPHRLADIGLSEEQARAEAARPAWNVPANWLR